MMMVAEHANRIAKVLLEKWKTEPDHVAIDYGDYHLVLLRGPLGNLNGYVGVKEDHPAYGSGYGDPIVYGIQVHGGLTFSGFCSGFNKAVVDNFKQDLWYFGFDTAHAGDYSPDLLFPKLPDIPEHIIPQLSYELRKLYDLKESLDKMSEINAKMGAKPLNDPNDYKDIEYVAGEVKSLYQQLYDMALDAQTDKALLDQSIKVRNRVEEDMKDVDSSDKTGVRGDDPGIRDPLPDESGLQPGEPSESGDNTGPYVPKGDASEE